MYFKVPFLVIINAGLWNSGMNRWLAFLSTEKIKFFGHLLQPGEVFRGSQGSRPFESVLLTKHAHHVCCHVVIE